VRGGDAIASTAPQKSQKSFIGEPFQAKSIQECLICFTFIKNALPEPETTSSKVLFCCQNGMTSNVNARHMRIAAISDIHGNLPALNAVLHDIARRGADVTVNLGDILSGPLQVAETAERLMALNLPTIAGNHERQLLALWDSDAAPDLRDSDGMARTLIESDHADWLQRLPKQLWLGGEVLLVHGTPRSDLEYNLETVTPDFGEAGGRGIRAANERELAERFFGDDGLRLKADRASLILCGHTHVPRACLVRGTLIVNPGSVGLQAYDDAHPHRHMAENMTPLARYAIVEKFDAGWQCEHIAVPYAFEPMAQLAAQRGRMDWAHALRTGRMARND
jgi:predicted phosphodiesterase